MNVIKSDILIIGGGIAGCFAAIRASEMGSSVVLLDKATIRRGGSVGPGMDHTAMGVHPESMTLEEAKLSAERNRKELYDPNVMLACDVHAYERIQDLEKYGVPMQEDDGSYRVWKIPERHSYFLSYRGVNTKVKLAEAVRKTKTKVFERTMGVELLKHDGRVVGAIGMNTRTGELTTFLAKATIIATGEPGRQYIEPDGPFMTYYPLTNTGDAEAMAYRAGAKLANMEFTYVDYTISRAGGGIPGIKPFEKLGKYINRSGDSFVNTLEDSQKRVYLMVKEVLEGRGPIYIDLRDLPEEVIQAYEREMEHEWPVTIEWFKQRNFDFRKTPIPIQLIPAGIHGGPIMDEKMETSVPGLYAAGASTAYIMGLGRAAVTGYIAAEESSRYASTVDIPELSSEYIEDIKKDIAAPLNRNGGGINPKELELAVRSIVTDYVSYIKSEGMMLKGLEKLLELKEHFFEKLTAHNPHELMRCCEVKNIFDMIEMHIRASLYRKETRMRKVGMHPHYREDYPEADPNWEKWVVVQKDENGNMALSTSEVPELKEA